jgi:hypothetical protein
MPTVIMARTVLVLMHFTVRLYCTYTAYSDVGNNSVLLMKLIYLHTHTHTQENSFHLAPDNPALLTIRNLKKAVPRIQVPSSVISGVCTGLPGPY